MSAILRPADEILHEADPNRCSEGTDSHSTRQTRALIKSQRRKSIASILERETETTIQNWLDIVDQDAELSCIPLNRQDRTGHLPRLLQDLVVRLRLDSQVPAPTSIAARDHGEMRFRQGYTAPMVVEESRILQVSYLSRLCKGIWKASTSADYCWTW